MLLRQAYGKGDNLMYRKKIDLFDIFNILFMIMVMIITLYPLVHVMMSSFSEPLLYIKHRGILLWPTGFSLLSYQLAFENKMILISYANTIFYVTAGTAINLILTFFGAFVLSRRDLYFKNYIMFFIAVTMLFNGGLIPNYMVVRNLDLINKVWAMLLPEAINPFNLILMKTYMDTIPGELEESAKIDGANECKILFNVILPLCKPIIAVMVLFYGVGHWNEWFLAAMYIRDRKLYPLQLVLRELLVSNSTTSMAGAGSSGLSDLHSISATLKNAIIIISIVPVLMIYPFVQKYFTKGVMLGAIKG